jgi:hypothetical protein
MTSSEKKSSATITVHVPMTFVIRGGRKMIMSDAVMTTPQPKIDNALLKAFARTHRWCRMIEGGEYASITELAKAEGINEQRQSQKPACAPAIVMEILSGRQNSSLMLRKLTKPLPVGWEERCAMFGLEHRVR